MIYQFEHEDFNYCFECPLYKGGFYTCGLTGSYVEFEMIADDCPLETISITETVEPLGDELSVND